jgi:hypothetical protein
MKSVPSSFEAMAKATQRIQALCGSSVASELGTWLSKAQAWPNFSAFLHSVATAADKEALLDELATLRYALIFRGLGFLLAFEPTGEGPDLLITRDETSATNMRLMLGGLRDYPGRPAGLEFVVYGSPWVGRSQLFCYPMKSKLADLVDSLVVVPHRDDGVLPSRLAKFVSHLPEAPSEIPLRVAVFLQVPFS